MAEWVEFYLDTKTTFYANPDTIRKNGEIVNIWLLSDLKEAAKLNGGKSFLSMKAQIENDCEKGQYSLTSISLRSGNMGGGDEISNTKYKSSEWVAVTPGKMSEALWEFACGKKSL
jgi:hypothetical protein